MVVEKYFRTGVLKVSSSLQKIRDAIAIIGESFGGRGPRDELADL